MVAGYALAEGWAYNRLTHPAVWFWLVFLSGVSAVVIASIPFAVIALSRKFPRAAALTGADLFRPAEHLPSRWVGPSIGWPAFAAGTVSVAVLAWFAWKGHADPFPAGTAVLVWAIHLLRVARPWGHGRGRVPTRFPFGPIRRRRDGGLD